MNNIGDDYIWVRISNEMCNGLHVCVCVCVCAREDLVNFHDLKRLIIDLCDIDNIFIV